jgi:hypothetical protein
MEELTDALGVKLIDSETLKLVQEKIKNILENPPTSSVVNVVLNDNAALKHEICKNLIMIAGQCSEEDANWYIVRAGAERELQRLATISIKSNGDTKSGS